LAGLKSGIIGVNTKDKIIAKKVETYFSMTRK
jgi:hypothetical protein